MKLMCHFFSSSFFFFSYGFICCFVIQCTTMLGIKLRISAFSRIDSMVSLFLSIVLATNIEAINTASFDPYKFKQNDTQIIHFIWNTSHKSTGISFTPIYMHRARFSCEIYLLALFLCVLIQHLSGQHKHSCDTDKM